MTDGIVKVDRKAPQHELMLSSESEIKVHYDDHEAFHEAFHEAVHEAFHANQKDGLEAVHDKPTKIERKVFQSIVEHKLDSIAAECEDFWCRCWPLRELLYYIMSVSQKEKEIIVPLKILKGLIECFCMTKHVDIKLEDIESNVCGFKYKISNVKRVVAIFVERDGVMKNLKYDLSNEYNRLTTLRISLKKVY